MLFICKLWVALFMLFSCPSHAMIPLHCSFNDNYSSYVISTNGLSLMHSWPIKVFLNGQWWQQQDGKSNALRNDANPLMFNTTDTVNGKDAYGHFIGQRVQWSAGNVPFWTTIKNYDSGVANGAVMFETQYPIGAQETNYSISHTVANFPALFLTDTSLSEVLSWNGQFIGPRPYASPGPSGGPIVFYNSDFSTVLIGSAVNHFKLTTQSTTPDNHGNDLKSGWVAGTLATVHNLPPRFTHSFVLFGGSGITQTIFEWGTMLQRVQAKPKMYDPTLTQLSYQTDNGAEYCFCVEHCDQKLLQVKDYLDNISVPLGLLSFQGGWWNNPNLHTPNAAPWCVSNWGANITKFPHGVSNFQKKLGLPLQLYAPYFCADTNYAVERGGNWSFINSSTELPGCGGKPGYDFRNIDPLQSKDFYTWFMQLGKSYGMISFEPDFLEENFKCVPLFLTEIDAAETWSQGMADAAENLDLPIQYCMATPSDLLLSMRYPAVTNFRASTDYYYGSSYDLGLSSLLIWAIGSKPSKDTFWTTDNSDLGPKLGGCPATGCPPDHSAVGCELHTIIASMTTGPVGFSDAVGQTDRDLIIRTCTVNGTLLQPSKPLTTIDRLVTNHAQLDHASKEFVLSTFSADIGDTLKIPSFVWSYYFVSFQLSNPWKVIAEDFWPPLKFPISSSSSSSAAASEAAITWSHEQIYAYYIWTARYAGCNNGSVAQNCVKFFSIPSRTTHNVLFQLPVTPEGKDPMTPTLTIVVPLCPSGTALLGELNKYVSLSNIRFSDVQCKTGDLSLTFSVHGSPGEIVIVTLLLQNNTLLSTMHNVSDTLTERRQLFVLTMDIKIPKSGKVHVLCGMSTCYYN